MVPAAVSLPVHKGETMRLAKSIACGVAGLSLVAGTALAGEGSFGMNDSWSSNEPMASNEPMVQEQTFILLEPVDVTYVYGIDENRDGTIDSYLLLEESDTLG
jgi:hypothetical protein